MLQSKYNIGNFDKRITIIKKVVTINSFNGESETWILHKLKWAKEDNAGLGSTGTEVIQADKITAIRKTTYVIRYDDTIDEEMRVVFRSKVYDIVSLKLADGNRDRFLSIECQYLEGEVWT